LEGGYPVLNRLNRWFTGLINDGPGIDPERRNTVLLIGGISLVVVFALVLIAFGYYRDRIEPRGDAVLLVGERKFNYAYVERRAKSDAAQGRFDPRDVTTSITNTIAGIQREELVRILARERGLTASDEEIDAAIKKELGLGDTVSHDEMAGVLRRLMLRIDMTLNDFLEVMEARVLEEKIKQQFISALPTEAEQVNLLLIQAGSQARALQAKAELDAGTPFSEVANEYVGTGDTKADGQFGWAPRELLEPQLADVAFSTSGRSGIIETEKDFYIIEVLGKEVRPIEDDVKEEIAEKEFLALIEKAFDSTPFAYNLTTRQILSIADAVGALSGG
jgi:parvulin-like peptidyl-prolyl isomerase